jgi:hypothetical protein
LTPTFIKDVADSGAIQKSSMHLVREMYTIFEFGNNQSLLDIVNINF